MAASADSSLGRAVREADCRRGRGGPASTSYRYDAAGELVGVDGPAVSASYSYNGDGLRVSATTNGVTARFSWDVLAGVPALLSDGSRDFVYGDGVTPILQWDAASGTVTYLHADRIGSVRALSNAAGVKVGTASYEAYGNPTHVSGVGSLRFPR